MKSKSLLYPDNNDSEDDTPPKTGELEMRELESGSNLDQWFIETIDRVKKPIGKDSKYYD